MASIERSDIIVADQAGVVVVPQEIASELLERLKSHQASNAEYLANVKRGVFSNQWVDKLLGEAGCPIIEEPPPVAQSADDPSSGDTNELLADWAALCRDDSPDINGTVVLPIEPSVAACST